MTAFLDTLWFLFINAVLPLGVPVLIAFAFGKY